MGNSASTVLITPTSRKLFWGRQKEDRVKLEDFLTQYEEESWGIKGKQRISVKRVHLARSIRYIDLAAQESDSFYPNGGEMLNPAFVGDQGSWMTVFAVDNWNYTTTQQVGMFEGLTAQPLWCHCNMGGLSYGVSVKTALSLIAPVEVWTHKQEERPQWKCKWDVSLLRKQIFYLFIF